MNQRRVRFKLPANSSERGGGNATAATQLPNAAAAAVVTAAVDHRSPQHPTVVVVHETTRCEGSPSTLQPLQKPSRINSLNIKSCEIKDPISKSPKDLKRLENTTTPIKETTKKCDPINLPSKITPTSKEPKRYEYINGTTSQKTNDNNSYITKLDIRSSEFGDGSRPKRRNRHERIKIESNNKEDDRNHFNTINSYFTNFEIISLENPTSVDNIDHYINKRTNNHRYIDRNDRFKQRSDYKYINRNMDRNITSKNDVKTVKSKTETKNKNTSSTVNIKCDTFVNKSAVKVSYINNNNNNNNNNKIESRFTVTPASSSSSQQRPLVPVMGKPHQSSLLRAAKEGDETVLRNVLRRVCVVGVVSPDSEVNCVDDSGRTPLSHIASLGTTDILETLLRVPGVDVNKPDNEGNTPLHYASQAGHVECVNFLLNRCGVNIDVDAKNQAGFTPLMKAALQGRLKCAKLLLYAGASPLARDEGRGLRADQWARFCGRHTCANEIEKFCALAPIQEDIKIPDAVRKHGNGIKQKIKRVFRNTSGSSDAGSECNGSTRLVAQLSAAALCSPLLPTAPSPLTVPKVQVTLIDNPTEPVKYSNSIPYQEERTRTKKKK